MLVSYCPLLFSGFRDSFQLRSRAQGLAHGPRPQAVGPLVAGEFLLGRVPAERPPQLEGDVGHVAQRGRAMADLLVRAGPLARADRVEPVGVVVVVPDG